MNINGSVSAGELEFTIELDTDEVWNEIEDQVESKAYDVAQDAAREAVENADFGVDYSQGATDLLREYNPGAGCSLAREFESAVRGAVTVSGWLTDQIKDAVNETAVTAVNPDGVRAMVREEIRLAVTAVISELTKAPPSVV